MTRTFSVSMALLVWSSAMTAFAQSTAPVTVTAWGMHFAGKYTYRFEVQNSTSAPVTRILIGHFFSTDEGRVELSVWPETADGSLRIPSNIATRPNGWDVGIHVADEQTNFSLEWIEASYLKKQWPLAPPIAEGQSAVQGNRGIPPGESWDNFSISLPQQDPGYVTGHATIDYGDEYINVPIHKGDTLAPTLTLSVERSNQNDGHGHWAAFDVRASASDNYDPGPTLDFTPVTANQPIRAGEVSIDGKPGRWKLKLRNVPGRTYRLQVSSSDASGNKSTKVFEYVVPGNGRR